MPMSLHSIDSQDEDVEEDGDLALVGRRGHDRDADASAIDSMDDESTDSAMDDGILEQQALAKTTDSASIEDDQVAKALALEQAQILHGSDLHEPIEIAEGMDGHHHDLINNFGDTTTHVNTVEDTAFGLPNVAFNAATGPRRSSLQMIASAAKEFRDMHLGSVTNPHADTDAEKAFVAKRNAWWCEAARTIGYILLFIDALYVLVSVPFRIGFFYDPWDSTRKRGEWTDALTIFTILDGVGEVVRAVFLWKLTFHVGSTVHDRTSTLSRTPSKTAAKPTLGVRNTRQSLFSARGSVSSASPAVKAAEALAAANPAPTEKRKTTLFKLILLLVCSLPLEAIAFGVDYNLLHVIRCGKVVVAGYTITTSYAALLLRCRRFRWAQWLSFSTLALPFYLFWLGLYLCHVSACGYMLLANIECGLRSQHCSKAPIPGSWVLKDNMEQAQLWRKYVRSMYWASKTVTTLGQGDLVPATQMETNYCILVQYISGLWATAFLASCTFYFSRRDRDIDSGVSTRLNQSLRFLKSRKVPAVLAIQIRNYYQYLQRTRNGIEEAQVLATLPAHYRSQCAFFIKYRLLAKIPFFEKQPKAFLRTVVECIESDFLSPKQTVLALFEMMELVIVARGEVRVLDQSKVIVQTLLQEQWFGDESLFEESRSKYEYEAHSFCEVLRLPRQLLLASMEKHFPRLKIATMLAQQKRRAAMIPASHSPLKMSQSTLIINSREPGRSTIFQSLQQRFGSSPSDSGVLWFHPGSAFRKRWRRWKVAMLIFVAFQAPYEVAFEWRIGLLSSETSTIQRVFYLMSIGIEAFFYVDWYFRVFVFARTSAQTKTPRTDESTRDVSLPRSVREDAMAAAAEKAKDGLVTNSHDLARIYWAGTNIWFDVAVNAPLAIVWNLMDQSAFTMEVRELLRFSRLLSFGRLVVLGTTLKKIMVEIDFSPASQLLTNVIVYCVIAANAMACYFYLLADDKSFYDALPIGYDPDITPVTGAQCLEQATLFSNCTWFIYDRSTYPIKARYIRSLHWSLVLLSTVGYGDILAFSNSECLIGFWWIYLGALTCYFTSCAVGSVISQVTVMRRAKALREEEITLALVRTNISPELRLLIRSHYETNWELNGSVLPENELMDHLPRSLRHQLSSTLYVQDIRRCYVFANLGSHTAMIRDIALLLSAEVFLPGVVIIQQGHLATSLYLIQSGDVELILPLDTSHRTTSAVRRRSVLETHAGLRNPFVRLWYWIHFRIRPARSRTSSQLNASGLTSSRSQLLGIPVVALKGGDCFGEEGLLPHHRTPLRVSARALTGTQVVKLQRDDFMRLVGRYPVQVRQIVTHITTRQGIDALLFETIRGNVKTRPKALEFIGMTPSLYCETKVAVNNIITPDRLRFRIWHTVHSLIVLYNFYVITFRLAFLPTPSRNAKIALTVIDYVMDAFLYADIYMKWNRFGFEEYGNNIVDLGAIRRRYKKRWFKLDCWSMLPLFYQGDFFLMSLARLPRLLKSPQLLEAIRSIERILRDKFMQGGSTMLTIFDLFKILAIFLSAAHHVGSLYFLLGRLLTTHGLAAASWITVDPILSARPGDVLAQYNRAIYWCLETFTVVCFGDVIARSAPETLFASFTCIMGWMSVGQIVGRITSLMANLDKESSDHTARVENFEEFAREHQLPRYLRERAIESTEYKSKCVVEISLRSTFQDLPPALHAALFDELYGAFVRRVPELSGVLNHTQMRVLTEALTLHLFMTDDLIIEEGRLGLKLYIMKEGRAEHYSAALQLVFAPVYEGQMFGDMTFFQPNERHKLSVRACRSCQVLELDRNVWMELWDEGTRQHLEEKLAARVKLKQEQIAVAHRNIALNFNAMQGGDPNYEEGAGAPAGGPSRAVNQILSRSDLRVDAGLQTRSNLHGFSSRLAAWKQWARIAVSSKVSPALVYRATRASKKKTAILDPDSRQKLRRSLGITNGATFRTLTVIAEDHQAPDPARSTALSGSQRRSAYSQHMELIRSRFERRQVNEVFNVRRTLSAEPQATENNAVEIWVEPPPPPSFCLESSGFRRLWSAVMYFICLYYVVIVPFRVSFAYEYLSSEDDVVSVRAWFVLEYFLDALCIVDFVLHKNYFTFVHRGTLVTESHAIRDHYFREGTYLIDLFCILPFEVLLPIAPLDNAPGTSMKVTWYRVAVCRINKMARIAHLHELGAKLQRVLVYDMKSTYVRASAIYFVRFAFDFALGAHWLACMFYGATFNAIDVQYASWLTTPGMLTFEGRATEKEVGAVPWTVKYARSYHFSMGAITTVSYGDIAPQNAWETFVVTFVIVVSIVLFGMLSGGFSQMFEMDLGTRADYEEKIASVAHFMTYHKFPARIWKHMQSYFVVHWSESQGKNEEELLSGLPASVKDDITLHVKQDFIKEMKLFAGCDEAFVRAVVAAFDQELFVRNDVIITYGDRGRSLYVIEYGSVLVRIPQGPVVESAQAGARTSVSVAADVEIIKGRLDFFGEKSLIFDIPRSATCIALSSCGMLILTVEKYEAIIQQFPEYREKNMHAWIFSSGDKHARAANAIRRLLGAVKTFHRGAAQL